MTTIQSNVLIHTCRQKYTVLCKVAHISYIIIPWTDPDDHAVRHHQPERLRDPGLPLQPQALHHRAPSGEECQEAHHEHRQEASDPPTGNRTFKAVLICQIMFLLVFVLVFCQSVSLKRVMNFPLFPLSIHIAEFGQTSIFLILCICSEASATIDALSRCHEQ